MLRDFSQKSATIFSALDNTDEETNTNGIVNKIWSMNLAMQTLCFYISISNGYCSMKPKIVSSQ